MSKFAVSVAMTWLTLSLSLAQADAQDSWQNDMSWAAGDTGPADCGQIYSDFGVGSCLNNGNRKCIMKLAVKEAVKGNCIDAYNMVRVTQCHAGNAGHARIVAAGVSNVCDKLRSWAPK